MRRVVLVLFVLSCIVSPVRSQSEEDSLFSHGTLADCIRYAFNHQPLLKQSVLDEEITEHSIRSKLAEWFPQLDFNYTVLHYPQAPVSIIQGFPARLALYNASNGQFSLTQTIFNRDVLLASASASDARGRAKELTANTRIDIVANVSKAFYAVLETKDQIAILDEDVVRLRQSQKDAYIQYQGGIVDNIDYKRATIALNNTLAQRLQLQDLLNARYSFLKAQMGYPPDQALALEFDSTRMEQETFLDTTQIVHFENRIEYSLLQSQQRLQEDNLSYYKWAFLPSVSFFGNYTMSYQNDRFPDLYRHDYPNSSLGIELSVPILTGARRLQDIRQAEAELRRIDYDFQSLRNSVATEYDQALAAYKGNLNNYAVLKDNLALAKEVYSTIQLQYRAGTKTYLDVISAETDLRSTQLNYADALYQLLSSKIDVQKALGTIQY